MASYGNLNFIFFSFFPYANQSQFYVLYILSLNTSYKSNLRLVSTRYRLSILSLFNIHWEPRLVTSQPRNLGDTSYTVRYDPVMNKSLSTFSAAANVPLRGIKFCLRQGAVTPSKILIEIH